jgi:hypothetical protein
MYIYAQLEFNTISYFLEKAFIHSLIDHYIKLSTVMWPSL